MRYPKSIESILRWLYDEEDGDAKLRPRFEFDPVKSDANLAKHGIDFEDVQELWDDFVHEIPVRLNGERRLAVVGRIAGEYWTAIVTLRDGRVRLISARRSSQGERSAYDRAYNNRGV